MSLTHQEENELSEIKAYIDDPPAVPFDQVLQRRSAFLARPSLTDEVLRQSLVYAISRLRDTIDEFARLLRLAQLQYGDDIDIKPYRTRHLYLVETFDDEIKWMRMLVRAEDWEDLAREAEIVHRGDWRHLIRLAAHVKAEMERGVSRLSWEIAEAQGDA